MRSITCLFFVLSALAGYSQPLAPSSVADIDQQFDQSVQLMKAGKFNEAVPLLEGLAKDDQVPYGVLRNLGSAYVELGQPTNALRIWLRIKAGFSEKWQNNTKLIQAYQSLGMKTERDATIDSFRKLHATSKDVEFTSQNTFCREQLPIGECRLLGMDYFSPPYKGSIFKLMVASEADMTGAFVLRQVSDQQFDLLFSEPKGEALLTSFTTKPDYDLFRHSVLATATNAVPSQPIIITAKNEDQGIQAEYDWLRAHFPGYVLLQQSLVNTGGLFDDMSIVTLAGKHVMIRFDISSYFGKF